MFETYKIIKSNTIIIINIEKYISINKKINTTSYTDDKTYLHLGITLELGVIQKKQESFSLEE